MIYTIECTNPIKRLHAGLRVPVFSVHCIQPNLKTNILALALCEIIHIFP